MAKTMKAFIAIYKCTKIQESVIGNKFGVHSGMKFYIIMIFCGRHVKLEYNEKVIKSIIVFYSMRK